MPDAFVPPADRYEAFLLDLDGVVYRGENAIPGAAETIAALRDRGRRVVFLTNNAARTPERVATKLEGLGIPAVPSDVVTSSQAAASMIARTRPGATAFVVGETGVVAALEAAGLTVVNGDRRGADVVVVGWDRSVDYEKLRVASVLVQRGARLVATNTDASYPAPDGELWPGAGALVAAVETATGRRAEVAGKPEPALFEEALDRAGTRNALVVGDRIETDVAGARRAGLDSAVVFTGAAERATLLDRDPVPALAMADLTGLLEPRPVVRVGEAGHHEVEDLLRRSGLASEAGEGTTLTAEDEGLLGTASVEVRDGDAYLHSVAVEERARGFDVGTLIVAVACRRAASEGARRFLLLTESAEGFFERIGFRRTDREELPGWVAERSRTCSEGALAMSRGGR